MVGVLLLAAFLRLWDITTLPVGLSDAELQNVALIEDYAKRGDISVFYEHDGANVEGFYHILLGVLTFVEGSGSLTYRLFSVWFSLITIALIYSLSVRLFDRIGGLAAASLMTLMLLPNLLARQVSVDALALAAITAVMLALARTMPVYKRTRHETVSTIDFSLLGVLLGFSMYVHPASLLLLAGTLLFICYIFITQRPLTLRQVSYIFFALLITLIVATPYVLSSLRAPELAATNRLFEAPGSIIQPILDSLLGIALRGDSSVLFNIPQRPLIDIVSAFFVFLGVMLSLRYWRQPRYALPLLMLLALAPAAFLSDKAPDFHAMSVLVPVIALFFGLGISTVLANIPTRGRYAGIVGVVVLFLVNLGWLAGSLFIKWPQDPVFETAYNGDIGRLAHYIDTTADDIPTSICYPQWRRQRFPTTDRNRAEWIFQLMNRNTDDLRFFDCRSSFIFTDGGEQQQIIFPQPLIRQVVPEIIDNWIDRGSDLRDLPDNSVVVMDVEQELADALGVLTTTAPASYVNDADVSDRVPVPPPIRFGGNLTYLGYLPPTSDPIFQRGDVIPVVTYWRADGVIPPDAVMFTHILSDPVTVAANRDVIFVDPRGLQERDVFLHLTEIQTPNNLPLRNYEISIGVYQASDDDRMPVFGADGTPRGNRIFLYDIIVR